MITLGKFDGAPSPASTVRAIGYQIAVFCAMTNRKQAEPSKYRHKACKSSDFVKYSWWADRPVLTPLSELNIRLSIYPQMMARA